MTTPGCPASEMLPEMARAAISDAIDGAVAVDVRVVWDPPWTPAMIDDEAARALRFRTRRPQSQRPTPSRPRAPPRQRDRRLARSQLRRCQLRGLCRTTPDSTQRSRPERVGAQRRARQLESEARGPARAVLGRSWMQSEHPARHPIHPRSGDRFPETPRDQGFRVGLGGIEPPTSALSVLRSHRLSYSPAARNLASPSRTCATGRAPVSIAGGERYVDPRRARPPTGVPGSVGGRCGNG
jgi:metal-sulfur cluster biosynthetic enzyme